MIIKRISVNMGVIARFGSHMNTWWTEHI